MTESEEEELLFFDTFTHDNSEDLNLDLVQFQRPVVVTEVRVVPVGTRVVADVPGNVRLGGTIPSSFKLELFINNLSKPHASTFEKLGVLEYKENVDIQLRTDTKVPTDGLIIKGWYQTITFAVYGKITVVIQDRSSPPPPPPPQPKPKPQQQQQHGAGVAALGLEKPDMVLTQKAMLERTSEWAEKAAALVNVGPTQAVHRPSATDSNKEVQQRGSKHVTETVRSPLGSPTAINPRDIPLEHRGGAARDPRDPPRDPRDRSPRDDQDGREVGSHRADKLQRGDNHRDSSSDLDKLFAGGDGLKTMSRLDKDDHDPGRELDEATDEKEHEATEKDVDLEFNTWGESDVLPAARKTKDHTKGRPSPRASPMKPQQTPSKKTPDGNDDAEPGEIQEATDDIYDSIDDGHSANEAIDKMYNALSDGEIQEGDGDFSEISSEENDLQLDDELPSNMNEIGGDIVDWDADDAWPYTTVASFNPYHCDLAALESFSDPSLTEYELAKQRAIIAKSRDVTMPEAAETILAMVEKFTNAPHHEEWIEAMENLPSILVPGLVHIVDSLDSKDILETIINWTFEGLGLSRAVSQPATPYKVRHLKMGIRVAGALCSCDSYIAFQMLSREVQHRLLDLYTSAHMSSSVKLHIIYALNQTTRLKEGLDWLLGRHHVQVAAHSGLTPSDVKTAQNSASDESMVVDGAEEAKSAVSTSTPPTGYQRILDIMMTKQCVRPMVGLSSLVRKAHIYEVLLLLMSSVDVLAENVPAMEATKPPVPPAADGDAGVTVSSSDIDMIDEPLVLDASIEHEIDKITQFLEEINRILANPTSFMGQLRRSLPHHSRFEVSKIPESCIGSLFHMFNATRFLESVFVLVCMPATCNRSDIFSAVHGVLMSLIGTQAGLLYLSSRVDTTNGILRALIQNSEYAQDEDRELTVANQLGLVLSCHLQAVQHIDQLMEFSLQDAEEKGIDDAKLLAVLHGLYSMTFSPSGRDAVVVVFAMDDNVTALLPFIDVSGSEQQSSQVRRSVGYSYAAMLLVLVVRHSDHVEWLEKYGHKLLSFAEQEISVGKVNESILELHDWLGPLKKIPAFQSDTSTVDELVTQIRQYSDEVADFPKGLVTSLRVLRHVAVAPQSSECLTEELKYKYVIVELYGANCMPLFATILQKVHDVLLISWQRGFPQSTSQKLFVLSLVRPVLALMKSVLSFLILARGSEFKDLSCLSSLLNIHTVLCSVSTAGILAPEYQQIQNEIVDILLAYTQPSLSSSDTEEALSQSLWSLMVKQVLTYTLTAPYTFLSGLILISELLPIPLPVQTKEALSAVETTEVINNRKRWSAYLHAHTADVQSIIRSLAGSTCCPLNQVLRRVCWQLADLAMPSALTVIRSLLDVLLESLDANMSQTSVGDVEHQSEVPSSCQTARVLSLLSFLVTQTQATVKAAFFHLPQSGLKTDEKYNAVLPRLISLLNIVSESPTHAQAQESIISIFQSLCDVTISLVPPDAGFPISEVICNSLPSKDQLSLICTGLVRHIDNRDQKFSSILPSLRTLTLLMNHDYGFFYVKQALEKVPTAFFNLFMQINATFSKDSSDCIATLSSAAECIEFLVTLPEVNIASASVDSNDAGGTLERTLTMSFGELRRMLSWSSQDEVVAHPLNDLDILLCEYAKDEETLKAVYQSVNAVVRILRSDSELPTRREVMEPMMPETMSLQAQFNVRPVYFVIEDDDGRLSNIYWLSTPMGDESDHEQDLAKVSCNLMEMASAYCSVFDLRAELEKGSVSTDMSLTARRKRKTVGGRRASDTINTSKMHGPNGGFVAPMRGRGFGRGMNTNRGDMFRSRPPNTSRPPSMHVDDYIKMEMQGSSSSSGPTSSNPAAPNDNRRNEGGGRGGFDRNRGFAGRGHFFNVVGGYGHRESADGGRGGYRGMMSRGGSTLLSPRGMMRGGSFALQVIGRGSPVKPNPGWGNRSSRQVYGRSGFLRGDEDHVSRDAAGGAAGNWFVTGGGAALPWSEHKDHRFAVLPPPASGFFWRDRGSGGRHPRTSTR